MCLGRVPRQDERAGVRDKGVEAGDQGDLTTIASQFALGEYADAVLNYFNYSFDTSTFPADQILIGGIDQLLGF
jgi:hypothetical protein